MSFQTGRRRTKKRSSGCFLTRTQIQAAYVLYVEKELGLTKLSNLLWKRFGFASAKSCADSLHKAFHLEGYQLRERTAASQLAQLKHGMARRNSGHKKEYQRWLRRQRGPMRPKCKGHAKSTDRQCSLPAMNNSEFCVSHDPERAWLSPQHFIQLKEVRDESLSA